MYTVPHSHSWEIYKCKAVDKWPVCVQVMVSVEKNTFHLVVDGFRVPDGILPAEEGSSLALQNPVYLGSDPASKTSWAQVSKQTQTVTASKQTRHNTMWGCDCDSPVGLYLVHNYHIYYDIYIYILENVCLVLKWCPSVSLSGWLSSQEECDWLYTPFQSVQCSGWWTSRQSRGPALLWWGNRGWGILCWHRTCGLRCGLYIFINKKYYNCGVLVVSIIAWINHFIHPITLTKILCVLDKFFTVGSRFELTFEARPRNTTGLLFHARGRHRNSLSVFMRKNKVLLNLINLYMGLWSWIQCKPEVYWNVWKTLEYHFCSESQVEVHVNDGLGDYSASVTPQQNLCDGTFHVIAGTYPSHINHWFILIQYRYQHIFYKDLEGSSNSQSIYCIPQCPNRTM